RVVGHEPHRGDTEVDEDLRTDAVLATVDREPELDVRLDGVATLILQAVRAHLVAEPDATPFVTTEADDHTLTRLRALLRRDAQLHAAVATHGPEHVAGEALAVHPHQ